MHPRRLALRLPGLASLELHDGLCQFSGLPLRVVPSILAVFARCFTVASFASSGPCLSGSTGDPSWRSSVSALDVWKMRHCTESGKEAASHLSTFGIMASGQGWISQRLIAKMSR